MAIIVRPDGPIPSKIMIVGEAPGAEEEAKGVPFVGASGQELNRMLQEAGITRSECFTTNVARTRPPANDIAYYFAQSKKEVTSNHTLVRDKYVTPEITQGLDLLAREIAQVKPAVILALGNTSLWALTGRWGITKWRGSSLPCDLTRTSATVIPTYHPAAILRQWSWRAVGVNDLRRARGYRDGTASPAPAYNFELRPSFDTAKSRLLRLIAALESRVLTRLAFDIETRSGHIACAGIAWSYNNAICVPFMSVHGGAEGYWSLEEETELVFLLYKLLTHPLVEIVGQNIIYDSQYTWRWWGFVPRVTQDTMISQHACFSDLPKSLAFLASMYCKHYVFWKDEGKNWDPKMGEESLWHYNCLDCVYTLEVADEILKTVQSLGQAEVHSFQQSMFWPVLKAMQLGVRIDLERRNQLISEVTDELAKREQFLLDVLGHPLNPRSAPQMKKLFYEDLKLPVQMTRAKKGVPGHATLDDEALQKLAQREPLVKPIINAIADIRTLGVFLGNFLSAPLDADGRMRCAYNIGGSAGGKSAPKTYRLSSSENAFGGGTNLQNIPSEKSKSLGKAAARGGIAGLGDPYEFPNIRSMFVPDQGYTWFDGDLDRADLQVVVWESNDAGLKAKLAAGVDMHLENAKDLFGEHATKEHRQLAKVWVHGTNYGGGPRTMAANCGLTVNQAEKLQSRWFAAHPGIREWHDRVRAQIHSKHFVENKFGYRWYIFDRVDSVLSEAIAWIPQSTVSIVINKIWMNLYKSVPEVKVLMQVHDSLCGLVPQDMVQSLMPKIIEAATVVIPYDDPLVIPFSVKTSNKSWGHCE